MNSKKRRRSMTLDEAIAYHEAGHVIATWATKGLKAVGGSSIERAEDHEGATSSKWQLKGADLEVAMTPRTRLRIEDEIKTLLAGGIAQRRFNRRSVRHWHGKSDREKAIDLAEYVNHSNEQTEAFLRWMTVITEDLVTRYWQAIEDLAVELVRRRTMSGEALRQWLRDWLKKPRRATIHPPPQQTRWRTLANSSSSLGWV
jgi:hypothetical protein